MALSCALLCIGADNAYGRATNGAAPFCLPDLPQERDTQAFVEQPSLAVAAAPDILLVLLDTLRADRVDADRMPALHHWLQGALHAHRTLAAATSTDHSLFSIFFMRPALEREALFAAGWSSGGPALQLARAVGYEVNLFAYPSWYPCPEGLSRGPHPGPWSNRATFELLFGQQGQLLRRRPDARRDAVDETRPFAADRALVDQFLTDLDGPSAPGAPPRLDIVHLYGAHDPYGVDGAAPHLRHPWLEGLSAPRSVPTRSQVADAQMRERLRNTYDNAVISLDRNLQHLLQQLDTRGGAARRLVVMVSDHGEALPEDAASVYGHGLGPSQDQTEVVMGFAGGPASAAQHSPWPGTASITALFPTLFDLLGLRGAGGAEVQPPAWSPSLLRGPSSCHLMVRPRQSYPPNILALSDGRLKMQLRVQHALSMDAPHPLEALALTDMNDRPLALHLGSGVGDDLLHNCFVPCPR